MKRHLCFLLTLLLMISASGAFFVSADEGQASAFDDVSPDSWYASAVSYCHDNNILMGVGGGLFDPHADLTRAMSVTALGAMRGIDASEYGEGSSFDDVRPDSWYAPFVNWAA